MRPGTTIGAARPAATASRPRPAARAVAAAARAFETLNRPTSGERIGADPIGVTSRKVLPAGPATTSVARTTASASPIPNPNTGSPAAADRRAISAPWGSSRLTAAAAVRAGVEQQRLGLEVVAEIGVEVEVVVGEVGEAGGGEAGAVDPVQDEGVRRHLDGGHADAGIDHPGEERLELRRLGCRPLTGEGHAVDAGADGADHPGALAGRPGDGLQQPGGGRLAVGAGDPEHRQPRRGVAPGGGRHRAHGRPHRRHLHLGDRQPQRSLHQQGGGAGGHGGRGVVVTVGRGARHAAEQIARPDGPAVVGDRRDLGARVSPQLEHVDVVEELVEQHARNVPPICLDWPGRPEWGTGAHPAGGYRPVRPVPRLLRRRPRRRPCRRGCVNEMR